LYICAFFVIITIFSKGSKPPTNTKNMIPDMCYRTEGEIQTTIEGSSEGVQKLILKWIEKEEKRIEHFSVAATFRAKAVWVIKTSDEMSLVELKTSIDSMNNGWTPEGLEFDMVKQLLQQLLLERCAQNEVLTSIRENGIQFSGHKRTVGMSCRSLYLIKEYLNC
jgi:hypothetical protein